MSQRRLLKLLRLVENRLCADCNCSLGNNSGRINASLGYGVWLCPLCADSHLLVLGDFSRVKSFDMRDWAKLEQQNQPPLTAEDLDVMEKSTNIGINEVLEKYPFDFLWPKLSSNDHMEDRKLYVKAKYDAKLFSIPHYKENSESVAIYKQTIRKDDDLHMDSSLNNVETTLPIRLAESFIIVGPKRASKQVDCSTSVLSIDIPLAPTVLSALHSNSKPGQIPDFVSHCVFPAGCKLSSIEIHPQILSFVLTDASRVKLYGTTLHVYEVIEQEDLARLLDEPVGSPRLSQWPVLYAPKALTILSHYPFFNLFAEVLCSIYHSSLSNSPVPLERLIVNFLKEVPLPPHGRAQVLYPLPDRTLQISRPPKNKLPMVDFSYRPLFLCLSVENILLTFRCLCAERSICVLSGNTALLTPVQETLISFLFPLQWQGFYIPVLPQHMTDILDAPVPFLVGMDSAYLREVPPAKRPVDVVFVNLDDDTVKVGGGVLPSALLWPPAPLPKSVLLKLRSQLEEFGGCARVHTSDLLKLSSAGVAFRAKEHLTPLTNFYTASVSTGAKGRGTVGGSKDLHAHSAPSASAPLASTIVESLQSHKASSATLRTGPAILDPINNANCGDAFDAHKIRYAFLRVFIVLLADYRDFFAPGVLGGVPGQPVAAAAAAAEAHGGGFFTSMAATLSQPRRPSGTPITAGAAAGVAGVAGGGLGGQKVGQNSSAVAAVRGNVKSVSMPPPPPPPAFNLHAFKAAHPDPFTSHLLDTQMFAKFIDENFDDLPEIRFFIESILAKKNRSVVHFSKAPTSFLDDTKDDISRSVNAPQPSTWGLDPGETFTYANFPSQLDPDRAGTVRVAPVLVEEADKMRSNSEAAKTIQELLARKLVESDPSSVQSLASSSTSASSRSSGGTGTVTTVQGERLNLLTSMKPRNSRIIRGIVAIQAITRKLKIRRIFLWLRGAAITVGCFWKRVLVAERLRLRRRIKELKVMSRYVVLLQAWVRAKLGKKKYAAFLAALRLLQSRWRKIRQRRRFLRLRAKAVRIQAFIRGWMCRRKHKRRIASMVKARRFQMLLLWSLELTPLQYRSKFWVSTERSHSLITCMTIEEELLRLYEALGFYDENGLQSKAHSNSYGESGRSSRGGGEVAVRGRLSKRSSFAKSFQQVEESRVIDAIKSNTCTPTARNLLLSPAAVKKISAASTAVEAERRQIYDRLKKEVTESIRVSLYSNFPAVKKKKRKETLSHVVWTEPSEDSAMVSAQVVLNVFQISQEETSGWYQHEKRGARLRKGLFAVARAAVTSLQR